MIFQDSFLLSLKLVSQANLQSRDSIQTITEVTQTPLSLFISLLGKLTFSTG